ncbi:MAG: DUF4810 domain-containing protein [Paludibacteraceae bacterium]|nr:DUF4810 domain-containing protein [Bacteroidales bacterium]MBP3467086.1 DUF4810 domain-containing protein [Paludibacteraceae bacterium]MBQ3680374.1 DUF4810 domain-containing protein [Paludibacteraceae bacterium]MBQ6963627.1 DUF4810 domain-containing protein [Paludibacteraceae bacterium]MBQ7748973.1 DUF4810 domain-containing protein [Paludibacteraceae bacterium]
MRTRLMILSGVLMFICSCSDKTLYSWHKYEDVSYKYQKKGTDEFLNKSMKEYRKVIERQSGLRSVAPPGINAEYGYLLCKSGKVSEGIEFLKREIALYPESEVFISRVIKQLEK